MGAHGGYSQNQCLRFQKDSAKADILPFSTSVCRTCCLATPDYYGIYGGFFLIIFFHFSYHFFLKELDQLVRTGLVISGPPDQMGLQLV